MGGPEASSRGPAAGSPRLFAAVEIPEAVAVSVAEAIGPLRREHRSMRWTDPAGWHLTLAFLGSVPAGRVAAVEEALARAAGAVAPFPLALTGSAGSFGSGTLWAALAEQPALRRLAEAARAELARVVDLPDADRPFRPHLTLARSRARSSDARTPARAYAGPAVAWTVDRVVLMRSHLSAAGARYETAGAWPLTGPAEEN